MFALNLSLFCFFVCPELTLEAAEKEIADARKTAHENEALRRENASLEAAMEAMTAQCADVEAKRQAALKREMDGREETRKALQDCAALKRELKEMKDAMAVDASNSRPLLDQAKVTLETAVASYRKSGAGMSGSSYTGLQPAPAGSSKPVYDAAPLVEELRGVILAQATFLEQCEQDRKNGARNSSDEAARLGREADEARARAAELERLLAELRQQLANSESEKALLRKQIRDSEDLASELRRTLMELKAQFATMLDGDDSLQTADFSRFANKLEGTLGDLKVKVARSEKDKQELLADSAQKGHLLGELQELLVQVYGKIDTKGDGGRGDSGRKAEEAMRRHEALLQVPSCCSVRCLELFFAACLVDELTLLFSLYDTNLFFYIRTNLLVLFYTFFWLSSSTGSQSSA